MISKNTALRLVCVISIIGIVLIAFDVGRKWWFVHHGRIVWENYSEQKVERLRSDQRNILILVTGEWTMPGSFGHIRATLDTTEMRKLVLHNGFAALRADATLPDDSARIGRQVQSILDVRGFFLHPPAMVIIFEDPSRDPILIEGTNLLDSESLIDAIKSN